MKNVKVGLIGCGKISGAYMSRLTESFDHVELAACSDLIEDRARAQGAEYGVPAMSTDEMLNREELEIIINLTIPQAHAQVNSMALNTGHHVYVEKPFAVTREDGQKVTALSEKLGLRAGGAPDTFLGGGIQSCIKLVDDGYIGDPVGFSAFMMSHGHEHWHPDPEFYYKDGGGPLFDMGPYYLTALIAILGPVTRVSAETSRAFANRTIGSEPKAGSVIRVDVPTHYLGLLEFACGAIGCLITSFDVWASKLPFIELYGTEGTLMVPNPNTFAGPVEGQRQREEWKDLPLTHGYTEKYRGIGVADMALAIRENRPHRAGGDLVNHVLDIMHCFHESASKKTSVQVQSTCRRPESLKSDGSLSFAD